MKIKKLHPWAVSPKEAVAIQKRLRERLILKKTPGKIRYVAGVDVSSSKKSDLVWAGVVILTYPDMVKVEEKWIKAKAAFPYVPGLLSFREIPPLLRVLDRLEIAHDVLICDGQGIAHPRGMGIAAHLGLLLDRPAVGCAKSRLFGESLEPGNEKGNYTTLQHQGRVIGAAVRTRSGVKPVFVSPGHRMDLESSIDLILACCVRYKIPEPTRQAHILVNSLRRREEGS